LNCDSSRNQPIAIRRSKNNTAIKNFTASEASERGSGLSGKGTLLKANLQKQSSSERH
jgi:hypothetical protein